MPHLVSQVNLCSADIMRVIPPLWKGRAGCVVPSFSWKIAYDHARRGSDRLIENNSEVLQEKYMNGIRASQSSQSDTY